VQLIARLLLIAGSLIGSWFFAQDALNFPIISFIIAMFLVVILIAILAFRQTIAGFFRRLLGKDEPGDESKDEPR